MKKTNWKDRMRYKFDGIMSKGTASLIGILFGITAVVVVIAGVIVALLNLGDGASAFKSMWISLMHAIDAGTLAGDSGNIWFIFIMTIVTICGLFITSMLIGIINTGIEEKMSSLRKGKSHVLEENHIIILGFNENTINILSELIIANENQKHEVVVVMDEEDKTVMEDLIHQRIPDTKTTEIICRSGQIDNFSDLDICSLESCRSIIINVDKDFMTIKAILACVNILENSGNKDAYVTALIRDEENIEAAEIAGAGRAEILYFKRTIARIMAHSSRESGISTVFTNLLGYEGDEIYVESIPGTEGYLMKDLNLLFPNSTVIGIVRDSVPMVNPPMDTKITKDDRIILIAEDDGVSHASPSLAKFNQTAFADVKDMIHRPQRFLILGCSSILSQVLIEEDAYVAPGTVVVVASEKERMKEEYFLPEGSLKNITLEVVECNIFAKSELEPLIQKKPENVLILTDPESTDDDADARTLLLLLQLRNISRTKGVEFTVTSEMRSTRNQELAEVTKVNDFVISSNITALMMTQVSQIREQHAILEDLLDEDGSEFYMKPASRYVKCGQEVDFYTIGASATNFGEIAVGYKKALAGKEFDIVVNPPKDSKVTLTEKDSLIVIAEN